MKCIFIYVQVIECFFSVSLWIFLIKKKNTKDVTSIPFRTKIVQPVKMGALFVHLLCFSVFAAKKQTNQQREFRYDNRAFHPSTIFVKYFTKDVVIGAKLYLDMDDIALYLRLSWLILVSNEPLDRWIFF